MSQANITNVVEYKIAKELADDYTHMRVEYVGETRSVWFFMQAEPRPCFTWELLQDMQKLFRKFENYPADDHPVEYLIAASGVKGVYNLGGDLQSFMHYIRRGDRERLRAYAYLGVDLGYQSCQQFNRNITSIGLIDGLCYGGGFEAALACNYVIAEESAQICFPEIIFNLFPGMGAYSYLIRRVSPRIAEDIITSGKMYSGRELYDLGVVDRCIPDGTAGTAVVEFISQHRRQRQGRIAMHKAREVVQPISLKELQHICDIWVDAALNLDDRSLKIMERFARAQVSKKYQPRDTAVVGGGDNRVLESY